jgi:urea carboxylase
VPPSGPMDSLSFRIGNGLLGNEESACGLECTISGPKLHFITEARIAVTGADMKPRLNGEPVPMWQTILVPADGVLELGAVDGPGARAYLLVSGGFDVPDYLGSATTFTLGSFGGLTGRQLKTGDTLPLKRQTAGSEHSLPALPCTPEFTRSWNIGVLYGPHGAPDFFTERDIETFFATDWRVHHNSSRTGVRLIGPKPAWARTDGGDAGLHPSNIHDNAYAIGAVDFTGDMPVILGPDGPSLGGFVCPAVVVNAELWKLGQLKSGDTVRFQRLAADQAEQLHAALELSLQTLATPLPSLPSKWGCEPAIARRHSASVLSRASGDRYLLIEFGDATLDLNLRIRVHGLMAELEKKELDGIIDLTPGIRSLQIHYDNSVLNRDKVLSIVDDALASVPDVEDFSIPSRVVHLPLSWDDPATRLAIQRYLAGVRQDAPWCPSNIEFIRRVNGLASVDDVFSAVFNASYLVLGLGDVYLGAPVATPVDPRHRLVTTKYNPARTWTPENAVGIGGAYLCVYGMEGPGGYQFVGRTIQMWNTYRATKDFASGKPWLLRFFDQIRFFPVSAEELLEFRRDFPLGRYELSVQHEQFSVREYHRFLQSIDSETRVFRTHQQAAFAEERQRWSDMGQSVGADELDNTVPVVLDEIPSGCAVINAPATASVWRLETEAGRILGAGQRLLVLEAMKMEIAVSAPRSGKVVKVLCQPGAVVSAGQPLIVYEPH